MSTSCGCNSNKQVNNYKKLFEQENPYCTMRTINAPRDLYNQRYADYWNFLDKYIHPSVQRNAHPMNGFPGCLGHESQQPICPSKNLIVYPHHVSTDSKLRGL